MRWWTTIYIIKIDKFTHQMSSPHYPQSNGKAEATVKSIKKLIHQPGQATMSTGRKKFCRFLLQYCNTPSRKDSLPPAQKLLGHAMQDHLPAHRRSFTQEWQRASEQSDEIWESSQRKVSVHVPTVNMHSP